MRALSTLLISAFALTSCSEPPLFNRLAPAGALRGTFVYNGPPPCTEGGKIVGNAVLLVFNETALPPPDGLASRSAGIKVISGESLFAGEVGGLEFSSDGTRRCPAANAANTANVVASTAWETGPVAAGAYQIRAFFDLDGDFHPAFRFSNLPTKGDIAGGAFEAPTSSSASPNASARRFRTITVGFPGGDGSYALAKDGQEGVVVDNITVSVAQPTAFSRPYFHIAEVVPGKPELASPPSAAEAFPSVVTIPSDWQLANASVTGAQPYLWRLRLESGVPEREIPSARGAPFGMHLVDAAGAPATFPLFRFDVDRDGVIGVPPRSRDNVLGQPLAPAIGPLVSLQKLDPTDPIRRSPQANPRVISAGVTMNAEQSTALLTFGGLPEAPVEQTRMWALLRPTAVCIPDAARADGETTLVTPFATDKSTPPLRIIPDEETLLGDAATLLRRARGGFKVVYACLPPGDFSINTVLPTTGQAWSVPNESGVCLPGEAAATPDTCGARARLASQSSEVRFGPARDPSGCLARFRALPDADQARFRRTCLRVDEQAKLDNGTLWE